MEFTPVRDDTAVTVDKTGRIVDVMWSEEVNGDKRKTRAFVIAWDGTTTRTIVFRHTLTNPVPDVDGLNPFRIKWTVTE